MAISNSGVADLAGVKYRCTTWPRARSVGERRRARTAG